MGELLARVARPADEAYWLEAAESRTVRQMRVLVAQAVAMQRAADASASVGASGPSQEEFASEDARGSGASRDEGGGGKSVHVCGAECAHEGDAHDGDHTDADGGGEACSLSCSVPREEAWLFESTRLLLEQLGVRGGDAQVEALLAEGQGTLLAALPGGTLDLERLESGRAAQQRWVRELARWRVEAEALCEERVVRQMSACRPRGVHFEPGGVGAARGGEQRVGVSGKPRGQGALPSAVAVAAALGAASLEGLGSAAVDEHVRDLSRALARHELEVSRLVLRFHRAGGWRRLGYATETQYARERLGASVSSLRARRALALRLEALPQVAAALGSGQIGVEAALQVARVATARSQAAWVERARQRTVKHLKEEVAAALVAIRHSGERNCPPPADGALVAYHELERAVVSGRVCREAAQPVSSEAAVGQAAAAHAGLGLEEPASEQERVWFVMLASLTRWLEHGLQMSATPSPQAASVGAGGAPGAASLGRVTLRLRMSRSNYTWWYALEGQVRRWLPRGMSWLRFLCLTTWRAWRHLVGASGAYSGIYVRDRFRCLSPVCSRRDVTPHHLRFRSAGGGDEAANIGSLCTWCHLWGVHGGRIRATGTAELIHWELGAPGSPCLVVHGRERLAA